MSKIEAGGPAFPILAEQAADGWAHCGMTLRDYFAAKVMQGLVGPTLNEVNYTERAQFSYRQADAMLEARK